MAAVHGRRRGGSSCYFQGDIEERKVGSCEGLPAHPLLPWLVGWWVGSSVSDTSLTPSPPARLSSGPHPFTGCKYGRRGSLRAAEVQTQVTDNKRSRPAGRWSLTLLQQKCRQSVAVLLLGDLCWH